LACLVCGRGDGGSASVEVLFRRQTDEARPVGVRGLDEYFSWLVVLMPLLTGMFAFTTLGRARRSRAPLRRAAYCASC